MKLKVKYICKPLWIKYINMIMKNTSDRTVGKTGPLWTVPGIQSNTFENDLSLE